MDTLEIEEYQADKSEKVDSSRETGFNMDGE